jgi:8-oxo-dGTP diphosphatase
LKSFIDQSGHQVNLTFDKDKFLDPCNVLIFPFYKGKIVMTKHKKRGIELPGGKIKEDETPLAAAVREVYEECGACLTSIELIGQYSIPTLNHTGLIKSIYVAEVSSLEALDWITDTEGPVMFRDIPVDVTNEQFSPFIKDDVYPLTIQYLQNQASLALC